MQNASIVLDVYKYVEYMNPQYLIEIFLWRNIDMI